MAQLAREVGDGHADLGHGVALPDGDGGIVERVEVNGDAQRRADLVLSPVSPPDALGVVVLNLSRDPATGERHQQWVSVKGTKRDAERRLADLLHRAESGVHVKAIQTRLGHSSPSLTISWRT